MVTFEQLKKFSPNGRVDILQAISNGSGKITAAGITAPLRIQHFISQMATETGGLSKIEESLNYSVKGLMDTFSRKRINAADCQRFGRKPGQPANQSAIANIVYGGEFGKKQLGNTEKGDGWRYRGGGLLQTTGRSNYKRAGYEQNPEALRSPDTALEAALQYWTMRKLNEIADTNNITAVRKAINGGTNGLEEAKQWFARAQAVFK